MGVICGKKNRYLLNHQFQNMILRLNIFLCSMISFCLTAQETPDSLSLKESLRAQGMSTNIIIEEEVVQEFAPDFEMSLEDGSKKKLSDFKGEVIYLSFWASWCKPCINGFNNYREMRESIEDLGIVMLNVSIDKDSEKWKSAIVKHQPTGVHAIVPHDDVRDLYQMYNVPRYEIVGKQGQFLYLSDEPGRDILENFRQFLNEKDKD